jgi:hypothetical protein
MTRKQVAAVDVAQQQCMLSMLEALDSVISIKKKRVDSHQDDYRNDPCLM